MRYDGGMALPLRSARVRQQRHRVVDATVEGEAVVDAGERQGQGRFGEHAGRVSDILPLSGPR